MSDQSVNRTWGELPEHLTVAEVAEYLRTSENFVYEQCRSGRFRPAVTKLGRAIRIRRDALRMIIEGEAS